jgi:flagellar biogenesis protein FliO
MHKAILRIFAVAWLALAVLSGAAFAQVPAAPSKQPDIVFKEDSSRIGEGVRVFAILAVVLAVTAAALFYLKRKYPALSLTSAAAGTRIKVIETRRLSPKLSVALIEVDGVAVLLTQSGDRVHTLVLPRAEVQGGETPGDPA